MSRELESKVSFMESNHTVLVMEPILKDISGKASTEKSDHYQTFPPSAFLWPGAT